MTTKTENRLLAALAAIVAAWESVPDDAPVPDEINVNELWEEAEQAIFAALHQDETHD